MSTEFPTLLGSTCTKDVEGKDDKLGPRVHISVTNTFVELHEEKAARQAKHKTFRRASTAPVGESPDTDDDELDMGRCKSEAHAYTKLTEKCELAAVRDQEASASAQEAERSTRSDSPKPSSEKKCAHGPAFNAASSSEAGTSALKDERPTSSMSESCTVDAEDDVPAASPGHELASLAPNRHVMFSVKNTFIQVSESDDESPSAAQPVVRRAETCPLGLQACEEGTDAVGGLSRTGSHHSEESMETDVVRRRNNFHDATCCEDTPCCVDELAGKWSADPSPPSPLHPSIEFGSANQHAFSVRNTFIQVSESDNDDESPSGVQPLARRAETEPLHAKARAENRDMGRLPTIKSQHSEESRDTAQSEVLGRVWELSQEAESCWTVQRELEAAQSEEERQEITQELHGHVWVALHHPQANYVLQKCILTMHPLSSQFIIDEIMSSGSASRAARSRCGCRVMQRLLEHCNQAQTAVLSEDLLKRALSNCEHRFARYVMQCLVEHGTRQHVQRLTQLLTQRVAVVCLDENACSVVGRILSSNGASRDEREMLSAAILNAPGLAVQMRQSRFGMAVVTLATQVARAAMQANTARQGMIVLQPMMATPVVLAAAVPVCGYLSSAPVADASRDAGAGLSASVATAASASTSGTSSDVGGASAQAPGNAARHRRRGAGGGDVAQATAEARDILESLRAACARRNTHRIAKAVSRLETAATAAGAPALLLAEAPLACLAAKTLLQQLAVEAEQRKLSRR
eukprot:TRINITY_DN2532_c0_g1_i3.p1 TRINITY_DN2532_c0_g1~~TRINITY_DN2532_c0_g1_i3.p1  ORF type:complete len:761 (+),score=133.65 TRINITY_DN2532_c0_g1_i3:36-2285(+)